MLERGFSIIICCYNSAEKIKETLSHISDLILPENNKIEIIIVNNNSSDQTINVINDFWKKANCEFRLKIINEEKPGLAYARRAGVRSARYEYSIFCDDDNWLDKNYLSILDNIFFNNKSVGIVGGSSTPVASIELPDWFYTKSKSFAVGIQHDRNGYVNHLTALWGAGLSFRTQVLRSIFEKEIEPLISDRTKGHLTSGGDNEICAWYIFAGYNIYYSRELKFKHFMTNDRLTDKYYERFFNEKYPTIWPIYYSYLKLITFDNGLLSFKYIEELIKCTIRLLINPIKFYMILKMHLKIKSLNL